MRMPDLALPRQHRGDSGMLEKKGGSTGCPLVLEGGSTGWAGQRDSSVARKLCLEKLTSCQ